MGADALEISLSAPHWLKKQTYRLSLSRYGRLHSCPRGYSRYPVMAKLSYESASSPYFIKELENAGVSAFSAIDALKGLLGVDLEKSVS